MHVARIRAGLALLVVAAGAVGIFVAEGGAAAIARSAPAKTSRRAEAAAAVPALVRLGMVQTLPTLNPSQSTIPGQLEVLHLVGATLTNLQPDGKTITPGLATSWKASDGGKIVTWKLRSGVKFSDGQPLRAADVAASWESLIKNAASVTAGNTASIASVTAAGATTVVFHLKSPYPSLPFIASEPQYSIFPASKIGPKSFYLEPISAGKYVMTSNATGSMISLSRNASYYGPDPAVAKLDFIAVPDTDTRLNELRSGELDIADSLPASAISQLTGGTRAVVTSPPVGGMYLYLNNRNSPLNNVGVRRAIALAVNRQQINAIAYDGRSEPLLGFWGTKSAFYKAQFPVTPDLAAAKKALVGTPCASGCSLTIDVRTSNQVFGQIALVIQQNLQQIGIKVSIDQIEDTVADSDETSGNFQSEVNGLYDVVDIPDAMLTYGLESNGGIHALFSGYDDPAMNTAAEKATASSGAARMAAIATVNKLFLNDVPYVPLVDWLYVSGTRLATNVVSQSASSLYDVANK